MNKKELYSAIALHAGRSVTQVKEVMDSYQEVIIDNIMNGEDTPICSIGRIRRKYRKSRKGINPQTKEIMQKSDYFSATLVPSSKIKRALKNPHFVVVEILSDCFMYGEPIEAGTIIRKTRENLDSSGVEYKIIG